MKKLTPESAWPARYKGNCILDCSINTTSIFPQSWKSTNLLFLPSYASSGLHYKGKSNNWRHFTCTVSAPTLAFVGKTMSLTWRAGLHGVQQHWVPGYQRWDGWDMSSEWMTSICLTSCSIVYWSLKKDLEVNHTSTTKTLWKKSYTTVTASQGNWKLQLLTEPAGEPSGMSPPSTLKTGAAKKLAENHEQHHWTTPTVL